MGKAVIVMSRLVKIVDNKYVQIEEYRNPNICFNKSEYDDFEDYCTLRETFDPFEMFYENQELKKQLEPDYYVKGLEGTLKEYQQEMKKVTIQQKEFINYLQEELNVQIQEESVGCETTNKKYILEEILQKYKQIIGVSDEKEN